jgi:hypothetical protein
MVFIDDETDPTVILDGMRRLAAAAASGCEVHKHERELRWAFTRLCDLLEDGDPAPLPDVWRRAARVADERDARLLA